MDAADPWAVALHGLSRDEQRSRSVMDLAQSTTANISKIEEIASRPYSVPARIPLQ